MKSQTQDHTISLNSNCIISQNTLLTPEETKQALEWYSEGHDLETIADQFCITKDQLSKELKAS